MDLYVIEGNDNNYYWSRRTTAEQAVAMFALVCECFGGEYSLYKKDWETLQKEGSSIIFMDTGEAVGNMVNGIKDVDWAAVIKIVDDIMV